jgi:transcription antitermination factor NusA-like protein
MVKTVLDAFCVRSGILCRRCQEKLEKGQVSELDLKVIRTLSELEKENPELQDVTYHKAIEADDTIAILVERKDVAKLLSQGSRILKAMSEAFNKKIRILGSGSDARQFLEDLLSPFSILTINTIWIPDGTTETKVILTGRMPKRMPIDLEVVKKLAKQIRGMTLRIEFEKT